MRNRNTITADVRGRGIGSGSWSERMGINSSIGAEAAFYDVLAWIEKAQERTMDDDAWSVLEELKEHCKRQINVCAAGWW